MFQIEQISLQIQVTLFIPKMIITNNKICVYIICDIYYDDVCIYSTSLAITASLIVRPLSRRCRRLYRHLLMALGAQSLNHNTNTYFHPIPSIFVHSEPKLQTDFTVTPTQAATLRTAPTTNAPPILRIDYMMKEGGGGGDGGGSWWWWRCVGRRGAPWRALLYPLHGHIHIYCICIVCWWRSASVLLLL